MGGIVEERPSVDREDDGLRWGWRRRGGGTSRRSSTTTRGEARRGRRRSSSPRRQIGMGGHRQQRRLGLERLLRLLLPRRATTAFSGQAEEGQGRPCIGQGGVAIAGRYRLPRPPPQPPRCCNLAAAVALCTAATLQREKSDSSIN